MNIFQLDDHQDKLARRKQEGSLEATFLLVDSVTNVQSPYVCFINRHCQEMTSYYDIIGQHKLIIQHCIIGNSMVLLHV